jgi:ribosome-associated protein
MDNEDDDFISKTRRKKDATALQVMGKELVQLSPEQLARIDMPETLREAVVECKRLNKHEAIRRQMQYIGRIMRDIDAEPIAAQLIALKAPTARDNALFHLAEKWRLRLLEEPEAMALFVSEFPQADAARLRMLVETTRAERAKGSSPKRFRELFHFVNAAIKQEDRKT